MAVMRHRIGIRALRNAIFSSSDESGESDAADAEEDDAGWLGDSDRLSNRSGSPVYGAAGETPIGQSIVQNAIFSERIPTPSSSNSDAV